MCDEMALPCRLVVTFITLILFTHVDWLLMFGETALLCSLVITFLTQIFFNQVNWLLMFFEIALFRKLIITFFTWLLLTHVYWLIMCGEMALQFSVVITFLTWIFLTNVNRILVCCEKGQLSPLPQIHVSMSILPWPPLPPISAFGLLHPSPYLAYVIYEQPLTIWVNIAIFVLIFLYGKHDI